MNKDALVLGAGGFIGSHLVKKLKKEGYNVTGVDIKYPLFGINESDTFYLFDLRDENYCQSLFSDHTYDEVYQLAADMGGMGFIHNQECEIMYNSSLININMINTAIRKYKVPRYFFSSSACVYRDQERGEAELSENDAYPAFPDNEYGWEKLYAERMATTFGKHSGTNVRIARFQNCYGPYGTWKGGREKAPAALSRKIAEVEDGGTIDVWGDGKAIRSYIYIDDLIDGIFRLMHSEINTPVNIGRQQYVSVDELAHVIARVAEKNITIKHIDGPVGVKARYFTDDLIKSTGWKSKWPLENGIQDTYRWIKQQVENEKRTI